MSFRGNGGCRGSSIKRYKIDRRSLLAMPAKTFRRSTILMPEAFGVFPRTRLQMNDIGHREWREQRGI